MAGTRQTVTVRFWALEKISLKMSQSKGFIFLHLPHNSLYYILKCNKRLIYIHIYRLCMHVQIYVCVTSLQSLRLAGLINLY